MVGTRAMRCPASRCTRIQERRSVTVVSTVGSLKAVLLGRILALADLAGVGPHRVPHRVAQLGVMLEELRGELLVEAEHIVQHQNLAITLRTSTDPDCGDGQ